MECEIDDMLIPDIKIEEIKQEDNEQNVVEWQRECESDRVKSEYIIPDCEPPNDNVENQLTLIKTEPLEPSVSDQFQNTFEPDARPGISGVIVKSEQSQEQDRRSTELQSATVKVIDGRVTFCCRICGYLASDGIQMRSHVSTHVDRPHKCSECSFSFNRAVELKRHTATHMGLKPYKCTVCAYSCSRISNLTRHFATHTGQKGYKCNVCSFSCVTPGNLKQHLSTHSADKPFKCTYCPYSCSRVSHLKQHMALHTDDRPFRCDDCGQRFVVKQDMTRHIKRRHGGSDKRPFGCAHCRYRAVLKDELILHLARIHPVYRPGGVW